MSEFNLGKGVAIHQLGQQFDGDVKKILDYCEVLGVDTIYPKIGNGQITWTGLDEFIDTAIQRGFEVVPWWYLYGYSREGQIFGKRMRQLERYGVRLGLFDVEVEFDNHKGVITTPNGSIDLAATRNRLRPVAVQTVKEYEQETAAARGFTSWWKPDAHPTPCAEFLNGAAVNLPQIYPIQDYSVDGGVRRLDHALRTYRDAYGWKGETVPFVATFSEHGWTAPVSQTQATIDEIQMMLLPGYAAWFLPHIIKFNYYETMMITAWGNDKEPKPKPEPEPLPENNLVDILVGENVIYSGQFSNITIKRRK